MQNSDETKRYNTSTTNLKNLLNREEKPMPKPSNKRNNEDNIKDEESRAMNEDEKKAMEEQTDDGNTVMDGLLNNAAKEVEEQAKTEEQNQENNGKTNYFENGGNDSGNSGSNVNANIDDKTAKWNEKTTKRNKLISERKSKLITNKESRFTQEQLSFQSLCKNNYVLEALIYERGPRPRLNFSRTFAKDDQNDFIGRTALTNEQKTNLKATGEGRLTTAEKCKLVKYTANLQNKIVAPGGLIGGVIRLKNVLNITPLEFNKPDFKAPTKQEVEASQEVVLVLGLSQLFHYIFCNCGGEIKENPAIQQNSSYLAHISNVKAGYTISTRGLTGDDDSKKSEGDSAPAVPKVYTVGRKLALKENIIPIKHFNYKNFSTISANEKAVIGRYIAQLLKIDKFAVNEDSANMYSALHDKFKKGIQVNGDNYAVDINSLVGSIDPTIDWGVDPKSKDALLKDKPVAILNEATPSKPSATQGKEKNYTPTAETLGLNNWGIEQLAKIYPAAARLLDLKVTTPQIVKVNTEYKASKASTKGSKRTSKRIPADSIYFSNEEMFATYIQNKFGKGNDMTEEQSRNLRDILDLTNKK